MRKPGCIEPVEYFINGADPSRPPGYILLAPYSNCPAPSGYRKEAAETLAEVDRLQDTLVQQERRDAEREAEYNEALVEPLHKAIYDRLVQRINSSSTSEYEKEFLRLYLQLRNDKRDKYRQRWLERTAYLHAREFDTPKGRAVDKEVISLDRIDATAVKG